jgi:hypothetical protein
MTIYAMSLLIVLVSIASKLIDVTWHQFHVCWINARSSAAKMINLQFWRDRTNEQFVANAMRPVRLAPNFDSTVAFGVTVSDPQPAARIGLNDNFLSQTLGQSVKFDSQHMGLSMAERLYWGQFVLKGGC